jgi:hypothetical protein
MQPNAIADTNAHLPIKESLVAIVRFRAVSPALLKGVSFQSPFPLNPDEKGLNSLLRIEYPGRLPLILRLSESALITLLGHSAARESQHAAG